MISGATIKQTIDKCTALNQNKRPIAFHLANETWWILRMYCSNNYIEFRPLYENVTINDIAGLGPNEMLVVAGNYNIKYTFNDDHTVEERTLAPPIQRKNAPWSL